MRKFFLMFVFAFTLKANAQVKKMQPLKMTDWYTLIISLIPDEKESVVRDWQKAVEPKVPVQWVAGKSTKNIKNGVVKILIDEYGSFYKGLLSLLGKTAEGFSAFHMTGKLGTGSYPEYDLRNLLNSPDYQAAKLSKYNNAESQANDTMGTMPGGLYAYRVSFPGKRDAWLFLNWQWLGPDETGYNPSVLVEIYCFFDKNEYLVRSHLKDEQLFESLSKESPFLAKGDESNREAGESPESEKVFNVLDGEWHSPKYKYSMRINGNIAITGFRDTLLVIKSSNGVYYNGLQKYTNGTWRNVILKLNSRNELYMKGDVEWIMVRKRK